METLPVCIAALFQVLGVCFFIKQPQDQCSPAPTLGNWLFLLATICFLKDINIYPYRYMHMGKFCKMIFEIIAGIVLFEISTLIFWCTLELLVFKLTRKLFCALAFYKWIPWRSEYWLQALSTSLVSGAILWFILKATNILSSVKNFLFGIRQYWRDFWSTLNDIYRMDSSERRQALRACEMATYRRNRRQQSVGDGEEEEEDEEVDEDEVDEEEVDEEEMEDRKN